MVLNNLGSDTYQNISVADAGGCASNIAGPVALVAPAPPNINAAATNPTTCTSNDGVITISGVTDGVSYTINYTSGNGAQSATQVASGGMVTLTGLAADTYNNITVSNGSCTSNQVGPYTLAAPGAPSITGGFPTDPSTCNGTDGSITLSSFTDGDVYTVNYTSGNGAESATEIVSGGVIVVPGLGADTYTNISVTDINGCTSNSVGPAVLNGPAGATITAVPSDPTNCSNTGSITINGLTDGLFYTIDYIAGGAPQSASQIASGGAVTLTGLFANTYTNITVSDPGGCTSNAAGPITLTAPAAPIITSGSSTDPTTCGGTDGSITLSGLIAGDTYTVNYLQDGSEETAIVIADGSGNVVLTNLPVATYSSITAILNFCTSNTVGPFVLNGSLGPSITAGSTDPTTCNGTDGSITLNGLTDGVSYTISYTDPGGFFQTSPQTATGSAVTLTALVAGTYTSISVTDGICSSNTIGSVTLNNPTLATITSSSSDPTTCGGSDGSIMLNGLTDGVSYTISYTDPGGFFQTSPQTATGGAVTLTALVAGTYTSISVTDGICSSNTIGSVILNNPSAPLITSVGATDPTACGNNDGTLTVNGLVDGNTYTLSYDMGAGNITQDLVASGGSVTIGGLSVGTYNNIFVTLGNCSSNIFASITLSNPGTPVITSITPADPTTCNGTDGSFTISGLIDGNSYTVTYDIGFGTITTSQISAGGAITISNLGSGMYNNIQVMLGSCLSNNAGSVTLNNPGAPAITSVTTADPTTCNGTDGSFTINGLVDGNSYTVTYDIGFGTITTNQISAGGAITISNLGSGTYNNIQVMLGSCLSNNAGSVTLNNPGAPAITSVTTTDPTTCNGTDGSFTINGLIDGNSYTVTYDMGFGTITTNQISAGGAITIINLAAGTYNNIQVMLGSCLSNNAGSVTLNNPGAPAITSVTTTDPTTCNGTDGSFTINGLIDGNSYTVTYDLGFGTITTSQISAGGAITIINLASGTYNNIQVMLGSCLSNNAGSVTLNNPGAPAITSVTTTDPTTCNGTDGSFTINGLIDGNSYTVTYDIGFGTITSNQISAGGAITISNLGSGMYNNIQVMLGSCLSNNAGSVTLNNPGAPAITSVTTTDPTTCNGTDGSFTINGLIDGNSYTVTYDIGFGTITTNQISAGGAITISNLAAGTYNNIQVMLGACLSNNAGSVTINTPVGIVIALSSQADPSTCNGTDGSITLSGLTDGVTYTINYTSPLGAQSSTQVAGGGLLILPNLGGGFFSGISVQESGGCVSNTVGPVMLTAPPAPSIAVALQIDPATCSSNDGLISIGGLADGITYTVNYTSPSGAQTFTDVASGGVVNLLNLAAGDYTNISVQDPGGCVSNTVGPVTLTAPSGITISETSTDPTTCSATDGSITISGLTDGNTYTVNYSDPTTTAQSATLTAGGGVVTLLNLTAGTYTSINVNDGGCVSNTIASVTLNGGAGITISATSADPTTCGGSEGAITLGTLTDGVSYTINYTDAAGNPVADLQMASGGEVTEFALPAGNYTNISVFDGICTSNIIPLVTLNAVPPPVMGATPTDPTTCSSNDGVISLTGLVEGVNYTISFTDPSGNPQTLTQLVSGGVATVGNLPGGTYTNIVAVDGSCTTNTIPSVTLNNFGASAITVTETDPTTCGGSDGTFTISGLTDGTFYSVNYTNGLGNVFTPFLLAGGGEIVITGLQSDTYTSISATDGLCPSNTVASITVGGAALAINATSADPSTCNGSDATITITGLVSGVTYTINYDINNNPTALIATADAASAIVITGLSPATYDNIFADNGTCLSNTVGPLTVNQGNCPDTTINYCAQKIFFVSPGTLNPVTNIWVMDTNGTNRVALFNDGYYRQSLTVAQNGTKLAYTKRLNPISGGSGGDSLWICTSNIDGSNEQAVYLLPTYATTEIRHLDFNSTNSKVVFNTFYDGFPAPIRDGDLFSIDLASAAVTQLTFNTDTPKFNPNYSPDDSKIIYCQLGTGWFAYPKPGFIMNSDGTGVMAFDPLTYDSYFGFNYAPDASKIVFKYAPALGSPYTLYTINADGTGLLSLSYITGYDDQPVYSPESNRIAILSDANNIDILDPAGTLLTTIGNGVNTTFNDINWVNIANNIHIVAGNSSICLGQSDTLIVSGAFSYVWSPAATLNLTTGDTVIATPGATTTYTVIGTNVSGCTDTAYLTVSVSPVAAITAVPTNPTICNGSNGTITVNGVTDGITYTISYTDGAGNQQSVSQTASGGAVVLSGLPGGTYTNISVTNSTCASNVISSVTLTAPVAPSISETTVDPSTCTGTDGNIALGGLTDGVSYTIAYTDALGTIQTITQTASAGTVIISSLAAGNYTNISVNDGTCSSNVIASIILNSPAGPTISETTVDPTNCISTDGNIALSGLTDGVTYTVTYTDALGAVQTTTQTAAASTVIISSLAAGTYTNISVADGACTSNVIPTVTLNGPVAPAITTTSTDPATCSSTDGSITLSGLTDGVSYTVNYTSTSGAQSATLIASGGVVTITNLAAGTYTNISATTGGCQSNIVASIVLASPAAPVISATATAPATCGGNDGSITLSGLTTGVSYTIDYTSSAGAQTATQVAAGGNIVINNLSAGTFTNISVTGAGCTSNTIASVAISDPAAPAIPVAGSNSPLCDGSDLLLTATDATPGVAYNWTGPNGFTDNSQNPTITGAGALQAGTYSVTAVLNNCTSAAGTTTVVVNPVPAISSAAPTNPTTCLGADGKITLSGLAVGTAYIVSYTVNTVPQTVVVNGNGNGQVIINNLGAGTYDNISVSASACASAVVGPVVLSDPPTPATPVAGSNSPVCSGTTLNLTATDATGGVQYGWSGPNSFASTNQNPAISTVTAAAAGVYTVIATKSGCASTPATVSVIVNQSPVAPVTADLTYCQDAAALPLTATGQNLLWYTAPAGGTGSASLTPATDNLGTIAYYVSQTVNGCESQRATLHVTVQPKPAAPHVTGNNEVCDHGILTLQASSITAGSYNWTGPNNFFASVQNISFQADTQASGVYSLAVVANGCASDTVKFTVTVYPISPAPITAPLMYCQGDTAAPLTAVGQNLVWYTAASGGAGSVLAPIPSTSMQGTTTYYVSQAIHGCEGPRAALTVTVNYKPVPSIAAVRNFVCINDTLTLYSNGAPIPGGGSYLWALPPGAALVSGTIASQSPLTIRFNALDSQTVYLTATDATGMCSTTTSYTPAVSSLPVASFFIHPDLCIGEVAQLALTATTPDADSFAWFFDGASVLTRSENSGGPFEVHFDTAGVYHIQVTAITAQQCRSLPVLDTIVVHEFPEAGIASASKNNICAGDTVHFSARVNDPGYKYEWSPDHYFTNTNSAEIDGKVEFTGYVRLSVTSEYGCTASDSILMTTQPCCGVFFPTAFSPNGDNLNDLFRPMTTGFHSVHLFEIQNRWGQTVFSTNEEHKGWDGTFNGVPQDIGTYYYVFKYDCNGQTLVEKGEVSLVR